MAGVIDVLKEALEIEHAGEEFYLEAARTCNNPIAAATFESLAEQERRHAQYFQIFYDAMAETGKWPAANEVNLEGIPVPEAAHQIFTRAREGLDESGEMCVDLHEMYQEAMEKENRTIALYRTQAEKSDNNDQQAFFEFLVEQEKGHLELLANTQTYLDDPAHWFFDQEHWIVEG